MEASTTEQAAVAAVVPSIDPMPRFERTAKHVHFAINQVKRAIGREGIAKDRNNTQQNYKFRGIDDVYNALNGLLAEAELNITPRVLSRICEEREARNGGALFNVVVEVEFDFTSAVDESTRVIKTFGEAMDSADKATNKAMSAAYKYACMQAFCIPTEGDNDADATTYEVKGRGARENPQQRQTRGKSTKRGDDTDQGQQQGAGPWYAGHLASIETAPDGKAASAAWELAKRDARNRGDVPAYNTLKEAAEAASARLTAAAKQTAQPKEGAQ